MQKPQIRVGEFRWQKKKRKFERGINPCHYCRSGKHKQCRRVKIDCTVCSCTCPVATDMRSEIEARQVSAKCAEALVPTALQCLEEVCETRLKRIFEKSSFSS